MIKVKKITIKNFKAITELDANIDGNIILTGENGVGKTSVMQFIEIAFGKTTNIPPGASGEGCVIADKDGNEYTFFVKFDKAGKPLLKVTTPDGLSDDRKGTIAKIIGAINLDVNLFVEQSKTEKGRKEQVELFKSLLDPQVKEMIETLEANVRVHYDERTAINSRLKQTEALINTHRLNTPGVDLAAFKKVDPAWLYSQLDEAIAKNTTIEKVEQRQADRIEAIKKTDGAIKEMENSLNALRLELTVLQEKQLEADNWLKANQQAPIVDIQQQIIDAAATNADHDAATELIALRGIAEDLKEASGTITANIESQRFEIQNAVKEMSNPVPGLEYDDNGLLFDGIPVHPDSLAFSKIRELGVKMRIAENPNLPLFISNGESIGNKILGELLEIADKLGLQIFMEQFERGQDKLELEIMADKISTPKKKKNV